MQVKRYVLDNGFSVILVSNASLPIITVQGWVSAGWPHDPNNRWVGKFVPQLLKRGTQARSRQDFEDALDEFALIFGAGVSSISPFCTEWDAKALATQSRELFKLAFEALSMPSFAQEEIEILQKRTEATLHNQASDPTTQAPREGSRMLYVSGHLLHALSQEESLRQLCAVTQDDLRSFHDSHYGAGGSGLVVVGDFDSDAILEMVTDTFGQWKPQSEEQKNSETIDSVSAQREERVIFIPEKTSAEVWMGQRLDMTRVHPDYPAIQAGVSVLGNGMASRLFQKVREEAGLSYHVQASLSSAMNVMPAHFSAFSHTNPANIHAAQEKMQQVIEEWWQEGITQQELEQVQAEFLGKKEYQRSILFQIGQEVVVGEIFDEPDFKDEYGERLQRLTPDDVHKAIQQHFDPANMKVVRAGTVD